MDAAFWIERWREGRIGFHEGRPNRFLTRHLTRLGTAARVLVPLCGKAEDLAYLAAAGHQVLGVELVEEAVQAFFAEHAATPTIARHGDVTAYHAGSVTILAGDLLTISRERVGPIDAFYDRAALIALPPASRAAYVAHLRGLLAPGTPGLVVTLEYPQAAMAGPPFAVDEAELRALYAGGAVELLEESHELPPRFQEAGIAGRERCFLVRT
jgi:thiopurine S-methyltransferase